MTTTKMTTNQKHNTIANVCGRIKKLLISLYGYIFDSEGQNVVLQVFHASISTKNSKCIKIPENRQPVRITIV